MSFIECFLSVIPAKTDPHFKAFLDERNPKQQHSSTLESYLIKPIQRVLKYPLLLKELYSLTDPDSEEHYHLDGKTQSRGWLRRLNHFWRGRTWANKIQSQQFLSNHVVCSCHESHEQSCQPHQWDAEDPRGVWSSVRPAHHWAERRKERGTLDKSGWATLCQLKHTCWVTAGILLLLPGCRSVHGWPATPYQCDLDQPSCLLGKMEERAPDGYIWYVMDKFLPWLSNEYDLSHT